MRGALERLFLTAPLLLGACLGPSEVPGITSAELARLVQRDEELQAERDPLAVWRDGAPATPASITGAARAAWAEEDARLLAELEALDPAGLDPSDRISREMLARQVTDRLAAQRFGAHEIPFVSDSGFHTSLAGMGERVRLEDSEDLERYLARLERIPSLVDEHVTNLRAGLARGCTAPRLIVNGFLEQVRVHTEGQPEELGWWSPFDDLDAVVDPAALEAERERARAAVLAAREAFRSLAAFTEDELLPGALESTACADRPDGRAWYEHLVRQFTTLEVTPEEVHRIGLEEVARIRGEMEQILAELEHEGTFREFLDSLREDPRFKAASPEDLLARASRLAKRADGALPDLFGRLPRNPYGVEPVPDAIAPHYTGGRYVPGAADGTRSGTYWVNTYALQSRTLYTLPALTLHEAVPGHHLQITLAQELDHLPAFRRSAYVTAFGEGWGLYAEWLGIEMGLYDTPYDHFGRLTYEMWRACRLVVDTGIHALGWDRQRAIDYLAGNTALSLHECTTEVDRYISWPGQALAYKMGELELRRLRALAEERLGEDLDLRAFHDLILGEGTLPLMTLRHRVEAWIDAQASA
jgi:uncharacterized protein (DUF885 family)